MKVIVLCLAIVLPTLGIAQLSVERMALNNLSKQKWERAHTQLQKAIRKDSLNTAARYVMAQYFFTPGNPDFQLDSAYHYMMQALEDYNHSTVKQHERLKRFPVDSLILVLYRQRIDSAAFERAKSINSEKAYLDFLQHFPLASQREQAEELRDETAYLDALKVNTYQAFLSFINRYPRAERVAEARRRYEKLLYESHTRDKRLASYISFLKAYPNTPYRPELEKNIFEISTASGEAATYVSFLQQYPESRFEKKARNILYHLMTDEHPESKVPVLENDSLKNIRLLEHQYLVPFLKGELFGFMSEDGREVLKAQITELSNEYRCGNIMEDVLVFDNKILTRSGTVIFTGNVRSVDDLDQGFLLVGTDSGMQVIHKSGFTPGDRTVDDAKLLNGKLLALKKDNLWSVWTLSGRLLQYYAWDDITAINNVIVFRQQQKVYLATLHDVAQVANQQLLMLNDPFDEVKAWPDGILWVKTGSYEGALDQSLNVHIKFEKQVLTPVSFGATSSVGVLHRIYNKGGNESPVFQQVQVQEPWVSVKVNGAWRLFDPSLMKYQSEAFDTIRFAGPCAVGVFNDSLRIFFSPTNTLDVLQSVQYEFIPGLNKSFFLQLEYDNKKNIYDQQGLKLFTIEADKIQYAGQNLFIISRKDKKGLVQSDGKVVLPIDYHAIGSVQDGVVTLLKSMKFGMYNIAQKKLIKPEYTKNLVPYNTHVLVAFKDGKFGLVDWDNKPLSKFDFDEIHYWNDSAALVKKAYQWMIYEIKSSRVLQDKIKDFTLIHNSSHKKLAIIHRENNFGVISGTEGTIIPITFSDIVNVGSADKPLYFTEKHVEEAGIFVVIYYSAEGKLLRREVYEQDDYDRIYCSGN